MKKEIVILFFAVFCCTYCQGQMDTTHYAKNTFYIEIAGNGIIGSINYERLVYSKERKNISLRIGLLPFYEKTASFIAVPFETCLFFGKKNFIEFGFGISYYHGLAVDNYNGIPRDSYLFGGSYFIPRIGYRFQKRDGGFFLRIGGGPFIKLIELYQYRINNNNGGLLLNSPFTIGLSLGYTIKT